MDHRQDATPDPPPDAGGLVGACPEFCAKKRGTAILAVFLHGLEARATKFRRVHCGRVNEPMIDDELSKILVCPENRAPLRPADAALLARLCAAIAAGGVVNRGGRSVVKPITAGLVRDDGAVLYPVVDGIPVLLIDEGISLINL